MMPCVLYPSSKNVNPTPANFKWKLQKYEQNKTQNKRKINMKYYAIESVHTENAIHTYYLFATVTFTLFANLFKIFFFSSSQS